MKPFFEIKYCNGFARKGKLNFSNKFLSTPFIIIPNLVKRKNKGFEIPESESLVESADSLKLGYVGNELVSEQRHSPIFIHSKSIFGINYGEQPNVNELYEKISHELPQFTCELSLNTGVLTEIDRQNSCIILHETPSLKSTQFFSDYEIALNQKRLHLYETEYKSVLDSFPFKMLGINFSYHNQTISDSLSFLKRNTSYCGLYVKDLYKSLFDFNEIYVFLIKLKKLLPFNYPIIVGGQFPLGAIPLLLYLGVDGFDLGGIISLTAQGLYISDFDSSWIDKMVDVPCNCIYCRELVKYKKSNGPIEVSEITIDLMIKHVVWKAQEYIIKAKYHLDVGQLREYVEIEASKKPEFVSLLHIADKHCDEGIISRYRRMMSNEMLCPTNFSHYRPEIINFIETIKRDVFPDDQYKLIILLPCSATKPYSKSPSHQRFIKAIRKGLKNADQSVLVHEIIITSPLGIVPRELEELFPAAHYNVSVTGEWSEEEIQTSADCLYHYLKKLNTRTPIIAHVTGGYSKAVQRTESMFKLDQNSGIKYPLIEGSNFGFLYSVNNQDSVSSEDALNNLSNIIAQILGSNEMEKQNLEKLKMNLKTKEELKLSALCQYQFGKNSEQRFIGMGIYFAEARSGEFLDIQQYDALGKKIIGKIMHKFGFITLNFEGGRLLFEHGRDLLIIKEKELRGTTIFPPILKEIKNLNLRPGDLVAVVNYNNEYIAIAEMVISARDAVNLKNGAIAIILKK